MRIRASLAATFAILPLSAQDGAALSARENKLRARSIEALHTIADAFTAQKQHLRALRLRREILDLDENDTKAREKCGFARVGAVWKRNPEILVLDKDLSGDAKAIKKIEQDLESLGREFGTEHKAIADGWTALQDTERARPHWQRLLRWNPTEKAAVTALALSTFEGFRGTPRQLELLRRARSLRGAVDWLHRSTVRAEVVQGGQHSLLTAANVNHIGVRTDHFEVWGSMPEATMVKLAQYVERTLLLVQTLMGTSTGQVYEPIYVRHVIVVPSAEHYNQVLDACASQFQADRLAFVKSLDLAFVSSGGKSIRVYKCSLGEELALDLVVRGVVQDALGIVTDGIWEGIGHTACGILFGRTMTFLMEQKKERTSTGKVADAKAPDLETWARMAEESAWSRTDTRTSELVLLSAARFTDEQRVKSWAMCNFLTLTRPEWVIDLDRSKQPTSQGPTDVEKEFAKRTRSELPKVDEEWREYWAKEALLRTAMAKDPLGAEKAPDRATRVRARSLVDAVDEARGAAMRGPVGFFVAESDDALGVAAYVDKLVKAEAEQKKKPKVVVPMPDAPPAIGVSVLCSRRATPAEAVLDWMTQPAQRDVLLHPGRGLFGSALCPAGWVLDIALPGTPTRSGHPYTWPRDLQAAVPGSARVADLGPRAVQALAAAGKQADDVVGMPLTAHYARSLPQAQLEQVRCVAHAGGAEVRGVFVIYEGEPGQADTAAGCVAFVPLAPLPAGDADVTWQVPGGKGGRLETLATAHFTVK